AKGVEIRTESAVQRVAIRSGRATGVVLADGTQIDAAIVVSNADPKRTFLDLVEGTELEEQFRADVRGIKMDGPCGKLNLVLAEEPRLLGGDPDADALRNAQFTFVPWLAVGQRRYENGPHAASAS